MKFRFGQCVLDDGARQLLRGEEPVHVSPKAYELLRILVESRPRAISKNDLQERLWPDTFVSEANLPVLVAEIRDAIGDDARNPQLIRTVHRFGYAFSGTATEVPEARPGPAARMSDYWVIGESRHVQLAEGENIVGREPGCDVWLDLPGISRRHARITVSDVVVMLEDLGSKNGTFLRGTRITAPSALTDRDEIRFGSAVVTFREAQRGRSTLTEQEPGK